MRYSAHIEMNSSLQEPIRQEQRQENKRMGLLNIIQPLSGFILQRVILYHRQYLAALAVQSPLHRPFRRQYIAIKVIAYCR